MSKNNYIARSRGVSRLYAHLILVTKYRLPTMSDEMKAFLQEIAKELCQKWQCECIEVNGEEDHLHLLFRYAPQLQLSKFVNNFKSVSSRKMRAKFDKELRRFYWDWSKGFWNDSYSIDSVGFASPRCLGSPQAFMTDAPLEVLKQYVQNQGKEKLNALRQTQQALHEGSSPGVSPGVYEPRPDPHS